MSNSPITSFAFDLAIPDEVKQEISRIPNGKSHGVYSCPTKILKASVHINVRIINVSIRTGVYPKNLKMAKIIRVFKADEDNTGAKKYRGILFVIHFLRM